MTLSVFLRYFIIRLYGLPRMRGLEGQSLNFKDPYFENSKKQRLAPQGDLFPDAKPSEDRIEDIVRRHRSRDLTQGIQR